MSTFLSEEVVKKLEEMAPQMGVDPALARAIFIAENSKGGEWNPKRVVRLDTKSPAGAYGVMQVMPQTHAGLVRTGYLPAGNKLSTLDEQVAAGLAAIKEAQNTVGSSDPTDTAVRYNASFGAYQNWKKTGTLPAETAHYITKVATAMGQQPSGATSNGAVQPGMTNMLPGLQEQGAAANAFSGQVLEMMRALVGETTKAVSAGSDALKQKVAGSTAALGAKTDAANAEEENKRRLLNSASGDMLDPNSAIAKAQSEAAVASQASSKLESEIQQLQNLDPLADPVSWFMGQIKLNSLGKKWDVTKQVEQRANSTISSIQQRVDAQSKIQPALVAGMRVRALEGEQQAVQAEATLQALDMESKARSERMQELRTELMISGDSFQRNIGLARMQQDWDQFVAMRSEREGKSANLTRFNVVAEMYGLRPANSEADRKAYGAEQEARLAKAATLTGAMGDTPGAVAANVQLFGSMGYLREKKPEMAAVITFLQQKGTEQVSATMRNVAAPEAALLAKMTATEKLEWGVNKQWQEWRAEAGKKSMDQLKGENPFKLNAEAAAMSPELAGNSFAKYVTDRLQSGGKVPDEKELLSAAAAQMNATPPKPQEQVVRELHEFFSKGLKHQAVVYGWSAMGADLSDPAPGNRGGEFKYRVSPESVIGGRGLLDFSAKEKDLNMLNVGELQNMLVKMRKQQVMAAQPGAGASFTGQQEPATKLGSSSGTSAGLLGLK